MDWDILIPILMFVFPVAVAALDKRAKKRRAEQQSRTVFPPAASGSEARSWKRPAAPDPSHRSAAGPSLLRAEDGYGFQDRLPEPTDLQQAEEHKPASTIEGQRAIVRERHQEVAPEEKDPEPKLRIDKKKLILYSEILKPKFDA